MMRILYQLLFFLFLSKASFAQETPVMTVEDYVTTAEVEAMVKELKSYIQIGNSQYRDSITILINFFATEKLSAETVNTIIDQHSLMYQKKQDSILLYLQHKLNNGEYQHVLYDSVNYGEKETIDSAWNFVEFPEKEIGNNNPFSVNITTAIGWYNWCLATNAVPDIINWRSGFFEVGAITRYRFSRSNRFSPYHASIGLSIHTSSIRFSDNRYLKDATIPAFEPAMEQLDKNTFDNSSVVFSTGFAFIYPQKRRLLIEIQGYAAFRMQSHTTIRFANSEKGYVVTNTYGGFGIRPVNFGVLAAIGWKRLSLYGKYDITSIFKNELFGGINPISIGLRFF